VIVWLSREIDMLTLGVFSRPRTDARIANSQSRSIPIAVAETCHWPERERHRSDPFPARLGISLVVQTGGEN